MTCSGPIRPPGTRCPTWWPGSAHQRLALLTTHRDEAAVGEHFQHWLGNVRRLPGTEELVLTRLDEDATADQIAELLGRPPPPVGGAGL